MSSRHDLSWSDDRSSAVVRSISGQGDLMREHTIGGCLASNDNWSLEIVQNLAPEIFLDIDVHPDFQNTSKNYFRSIPSD